MKLYKYTRFDIGKQIIASSQIALSKPQDFNDPFDCLPVPNEDDLCKAIDVLNGYIIDQKIFEIMQDLKGKLRKPSQKALVSFVLWEYRIAQKLSKHKPAPYSPIFTFKKFYKLFQMCEKMGKVSAEQLQAKEKIAQLQSLIEQHEWDVLSKMSNMRENLKKAADIYHAWQDNGTDGANYAVPELYRSVKTKKWHDQDGNEGLSIEQQGWSLVPSKYIEFIDHDLDIDFNAEMSRVQAEMRDVLAQEKQSQKMLEDAFRGIGYGIE